MPWASKIRRGARRWLRDGTVDEAEAYDRWDKERYLSRYPTPPRNRFQMTDDFLRDHGFHLSVEASYANEVEFTLEQHCCYLTTQSNTIAAIEGGNQSEEDALRWLTDELRPLFPHEKRQFLFGGSIQYFQKIDTL